MLIMIQRFLTIVILGSLLVLDGCSNNKQVNPQPAISDAPPNAVPTEVQTALDSHFQEWSAAGKLGIKIPEPGFQDLAVTKDGRLTAADRGEVIVKSDIVIGSHRLAAGTRLRKEGSWWTASASPTVPPSEQIAPSGSGNKIKLPTEVANIWNAFQGRYVLVAHRSARIRRFEDLRSKKLLVAYMTVQQQESMNPIDFINFSDAVGFRGKPIVDNRGLDLFFVTLLKENSQVGFMLREIADMPKLASDSRLERLDLE